MPRKYGTGSIIEKPGTDKLYIRYRRDGRIIQEATGTADRVEAQRLLSIRVGSVHEGSASPVGAHAVTYEELKAAWIADKPKRGAQRFNELDKFFSGMTVKKMNTGDYVEKFVAHRRDVEKVCDATIRRNLIPLKAMIRHAINRKKVGHNDMPFFPSLQASKPAGEYIPPDTFAHLLAALPTEQEIDKQNARLRAQSQGNGELMRGRIRDYHDLKPLFTFMYATGCRSGSARRITWEMVSDDGRVLTLPAEIIKTRKPLTLVLDGALLAPIAERLRKRFRIEGEPVFDSTNYRAEWNKACDKIGLRGYDAKTHQREGDGGARLHDLRCSGAVNALAAGVAESTVLKIGGWKTRAMLDRYNVPNTAVLAEAQKKSGDYVMEKILAAGLKIASA